VTWRTLSGCVKTGCHPSVTEEVAMSLVLGELATILKADDRPMEKGLKAGEGRFRDAKGRYVKIAKETGQEAGEATGGGFLGKIGPLLKGGAVAAATAAALALGVAFVQALDVEKANDKLAAQMGASAAEAEHLGRVAGELYAGAYGDSIGQVNEALDAVVSSIDGMRQASEDDLEAMTAKALDLATAFDLDVARAAQVAGEAVRYGLAEDANQAMDLITASLQRVPKAVREDLIDAIDEYGPFLESIGLIGEKAFGLLVRGAEKGMYGIDKTGDALKEFTIRATDMSTASKVGFDAIGLSQQKMAGKLLAGGETAAKAFDQIIAGLLGIKDPVAQSQAALALFGTPLEDLSVAEIPKFLASLQSAEGGLGDVAGAAERMGATLNDNAATRVEAFKRKTMSQLTELAGGTLKLFDDVQQDPAVSDFMGDAGRVLDEKVVPALRSFWSWVQEKVLPVLQEIRVNALDRLREAWTFVSDKIDENREELTQLGEVLRVVAEWIVTNVLPVLYDLYYSGFVHVAHGIGMVIDWISFWIDAFNLAKDAATGTVNWVGDKIDWVVSKANGLKKRMSFSGLFDGMKGALKSAVNWVIGKWNGLEFGVPRISIPGVGSFGGGSIGVPNIPLLAKGGNILREGLAVVGDAGPELVRLGRGAQVQPLASGSAMAGLVGVLRIILQWPDGRVIKDQLVDAASLRGQGVGTYLGVA
jgi:hypothetical protein